NSSARIIRDRGTSRPSALAVLRLMTSSIFVACWTGRVAGFLPFRICPTPRPPPPKAFTLLAPELITPPSNTCESHHSDGVTHKKKLATDFCNKICQEATYARSKKAPAIRYAISDLEAAWGGTVQRLGAKTPARTRHRAICDDRY